MWSLQKTVVGYIDIKQQEKYEKLKKAHSKLHWYFINATATDDNNDNDNTPTSFVTAAATTNKSNNNCNHYNRFLTLCLCVLRLSVVFKEFGKLFQNNRRYIRNILLTVISSLQRLI